MMDRSVINDPTFFYDMPVDDNTAQLALTFLSGLNLKLEDNDLMFLLTSITKIRFLKTGSSLQSSVKTFLETDLSEIPENTPILGVWCSTWTCLDLGYFSEEAEKGDRFDDFFLLDGQSLEEDCKSDNPQCCHLDYTGINETTGNFKDIELPVDGYHIYIDRILSELDYTSYGEVDKDYYKQAHPIIRDYIDSQFAQYLEEDIDE